MTLPETTPEFISTGYEVLRVPPGALDWLARVFAGYVVFVTFAFLFNDFLTLVWEWPGVGSLMSHLGWFGFEPLQNSLEGAIAGKGWAQAFLYVSSVAGPVLWVWRTSDQPLMADADAYAALVAYIIRVAFWSVFFIGLVDAAIAFVRVEKFLPALVGDSLTTQLGQAKFRGQYIHVPLMAISCVIAFFMRSQLFVWLSLLIVLAEFQIVISRFIFAYEQVFMGDLVRFWYAALFLLASAFNLSAEGHVRVDVFYANFSERGKAWANAIGSMLFGVSFCWVILIMGMWDKSSSLSSPLLVFEISQSGSGMYVKYLMAGLLVIFATTMVVQFASLFLKSVSILRRQVVPTTHYDHIHDNV